MTQEGLRAFRRRKAAPVADGATPRPRTAVVILGLAFAMVTVATSVHAQTPRIQGQGSAASGMGNAFAAQADDPSALQYNPAGMTQLRGVQHMIGSLFLGGTTNFTSSSTGANVTGDRGGSAAWPPPTHAYFIANLKDIGMTALGDTTVGIGVTVPFGTLTRYPEGPQNPFRTAITMTTNPLVDIKPTVAYKLNEDLSFGLGADIYTYSKLFGEGQFEQHSISPTTGARLELAGRGTGVGFNVSTLYTALRNADDKPIATVGLVYRSQAVVPLSGQFQANGALLADAKANLVLPQIYTGAIAIWPVRNAAREWKLEMDVDYVGWKSFRSTVASLSSGGGLPLNQNWSNSYTVMLGTEYKWLNPERMPGWDVALRGGYMNQQAQIPDLTFNPGVPSASTHIPSFGFGFLCKENGSFLGIRCGETGIGPVKTKAIGLDLSYQAVLYETRTITGNQNPTVNGTYKTLIHAGGVSLRFNF